MFTFIVNDEVALTSFKFAKGIGKRLRGSVFSARGDAMTPVRHEAPRLLLAATQPALQEAQPPKVQPLRSLQQLHMLETSSKPLKNS